MRDAQPQIIPCTEAAARRVLVVDDEPSIAGLVRDILNQHGYQAEVSAGGESGLEQAASGRFDLVISDFAMPHLNGLEFARRLRELQGDGRVIIISALLEPEVQAALQAEPSVVGLLRKPFDIFELMRRVGQVFECEGSETSPAPDAAPPVRDRISFG